MPYADPDIARAKSAERMRKHRAKAVTPDVTPSETAARVTPSQGVTPEPQIVTPFPLHPVTPISGPRLEPRIIKTVADAEAVASAVLEKLPRHEPRAAVSAQVGELQRIELIPSTGHKRRRKAPRMGQEPWMVSNGPAPDLDADGNAIPGDSCH